MSSCNKGGDPEPSIEEKNLKLMSKPWVVTSATLDGPEGNMDDLYLGMELQIGGIFNKDINTLYNYQVVSGGPGIGDKSPWPRTNDKWKFKDGASETTIVRSVDGLEIQYTVSETQLQLIFNYSGPGFRTSAVEGEWIFFFEPK
jgi:hypothetical protein